MEIIKKIFRPTEEAKPEISIEYANLTGDDLEAVQRAIEENRTIKFNVKSHTTANGSKLNITVDSIDNLSDVEPILDQLKLDSLDEFQFRIVKNSDDVNVKPIFGFLKNNMSAVKTIELVFGGFKKFHLTSSHIEIGDMNRHYEDIKKLFRGKSFSINNFKSKFSNTMKFLKIFGNKNLTKVETFDIIDLDAADHVFQHVKYLEIYGFTVSKERIKMLLKSFPKLVTLELQRPTNANNARYLGELKSDLSDEVKFHEERDHVYKYSRDFIEFQF